MRRQHTEIDRRKQILRIGALAQPQDVVGEAKRGRLPPQGWADPAIAPD